MPPNHGKAKPDPGTVQHGSDEGDVNDVVLMWDGDLFAEEELGCTTPNQGAHMRTHPPVASQQYAQAPTAVKHQALRGVSAKVMSRSQ